MNKLRIALISAIYAAFIVVVPDVFINRGAPVLNVHWQEMLFMVLAVVFSVISGYLGFWPTVGTSEVKGQRLLVWGGFVFLFLYVATCSVCERLGFLTVNTGTFRVIGLVIFCLGFIVRLVAIATLGHRHSAFVTLQEDHAIVTTGLYKYIRHPSYLGVLIILVGIPLVFSTWLPLFALPGVFIALKWRMDEEEKFLQEKLGDDYVSYMAKTKRLIPKLY
ncbi:MAG: isoprenylcysteine carboxylmethyltransferase family protein [Candidatus Obscuribacterales bacterium]|nr:isoprenylcysteine carboxylmethyltransferase family protein [Candidatus Obscuribacterales bacterium]